jgi:hypothetical protein
LKLCVGFLLAAAVLAAAGIRFTEFYAANPRQASRQESSMVPRELVGRWRCTNETSNGQPLVPQYHRIWQITGDGRVIINGERQLVASVKSTSSPFRLRVSNHLGDRTISVFSFLAEAANEQFLVSFFTGDHFPSGLDIAEGNTIDLTFTRID